MFQSVKPVIAMIHVGALPGTPASSCSVREIVSQAVAEARIYRDGGVHGIAIENMPDVMLEFSVLAGRATAIKASDPAGQLTFHRQ